MRRCLVVAALAALCLPGAIGAGSEVTGGAAMDVRSAPWTVLLKITAPPPIGTGYCSATIIDPTHVVTAAHCVDLGPSGRVDPTVITVRAGVSDAITPRATVVALPVTFSKLERQQRSTINIRFAGLLDAPGRIRTSDPRIRSPPLCPLSYGRSSS